MLSNFVLKYVGFFAAFCTTFAFLPQAAKVWKTKSTKDISLYINNLVGKTITGRISNVSATVEKVALPTTDPIDDITTEALKEQIENTINNFEPRVRLRQVVVQPNFDAGEYDISIRYDIVGIEATPQQLSFALQQTR